MKEKPTVIAVVNQKGGTAKTTTVENLGIGLAREGKKGIRVSNMLPAIVIAVVAALI